MLIFPYRQVGTDLFTIKADNSTLIIHLLKLEMV
jgi:hypothetical protein